MNDKQTARVDGHEIHWHITEEGFFADAYRLNDQGTFDPDKDHVGSFAMDVADIQARVGATEEPAIEA